MKTITKFCLLGILSLGCAAVDLSAQLPTIPPSIYRVSPIGVGRGSTAVLTIEGRTLAGAQAVLFDSPGLAAKVLGIRDLPEEVKPIRIGVDLGARVVQGPKQEAQLEVTVGHDVEPGVHMFRVQTPFGTSNLATLDVGTLPEIQETEPNDSPADSQRVELPATLVGNLDRPGDVDTFQFDGKAGTEVVFEPIAQSLGSQLESVLVLRDSTGRELARSGEYSRPPDSPLTFKLPADGKYTISISDFEKRGGYGFFYRLNAGALPFVTEFFPLGVPAGKISEVAVKGANLGEVRAVKVEAPARADGSQTVSVRVKTASGESLNTIRLAVGNEPDVAENEPNNMPSEAQRIPVPATINGRIYSGKNGGQPDDYFRFAAKKGKDLIIDVVAARLGSPLDSVVEVLDARGHEIPMTAARAVAETTLTLSDRDSRTANIRLTSNTDIHPNDYLMMSDELVQVMFVPDQPDEDVVVKNFAGERLALFNTSTEAHAINAPVYKVRLLEPNKDFPANGLPVFHLTYRNDDGGPGYGQDSHLDFTAPEDGEYLVHVKDVRGLEGDQFAYRLTVREAAPDFELTTQPSNPNVPRGGRVPIMVTANRTKGYDGPIDVEVKGVPQGVTASTATIPAGQDSTVVVLSASAEPPAAAMPPAPFQIVGRAKVSGRELERVADASQPLRVVALMPPPDLVVAAEPQEIVLEPGKEVLLTLRCERKNSFKGRVPYQIANLPPGVRIVNIGFTGGFVEAKETTRTIALLAEDWAQPLEQLIYVVGEVESNSTTAHVSAPLKLKILRKKEMASAGTSQGSPNR